MMGSILKKSKDRQTKKSNASPYEEANLFSKLFFRWVGPLLKIGSKRPLQDEDLYETTFDDESKYQADEIRKNWNSECLKKEPSLLRALIKTMYKRVLFITIFILIEETLIVIQPLLITYLIRYFSHQIDVKVAVILGIILCLTIFIQFLATHQYFFQIYRYGMQARVALSGLIYEKTLKLNSKYGQNVNTIQLLSNDTSKVELGFIFLVYMVLAPLITVAILAILIVNVDLYILSGFFLIILVLIIQIVLSRVYTRYRTKLSQATDKRISEITEILAGIKIIKMYCWEEAFRNVVEKIRQKELKFQKYINSISGVNNFIDVDFSIVMTFVSVVIFVQYVNKPLIPSIVILSISYYNKLSITIGFQFMKSIMYFISAKISLKRIQEYLLLDEIQKKNSETSRDTRNFLKVDNLSAKWSKNKDTFELKNISFSLVDTELLAISGFVGSGKTSLLLSLLGEMPHISGSINHHGQMFYVSQEPWIYSASLKENILFGNECNELKFKECLKACALDEDIKRLPNKENSIIGEKGINLSGGQRARVALARALYYDADIYLFDDPLSAVDANVAKYIYEKCINGYLKNKIRILVTHHVHFLVNVKKRITLQNGKQVVIQDDEDGLRSLDSNETAEMSTIDLGSQDESDPISNLDETKIERQDALDETFKEKHITGSIKWNVYKWFFKSKILFFMQLLILLMFMAAQGFVVASSYYLSNWSSDEEKYGKERRAHMPRIYPQRDQIFKIYIALSCLAVFFQVLRTTCFYAMCLHLSKSFHSALLACVLAAKIRFFDLNPLGRILNRFAKDIETLDDLIPNDLFSFLQCAMIVLGSVVISIVINYFIIFSLIPIVIVFVIIRKKFMASSIEIKRIESINKSKILVHANNTLVGLSTIRASNNEEQFTKEFFAHLNNHTRAFFLTISTNRWFGIRLDITLFIFITFSVFVCILAKTFLRMNAGEIGILLVYQFQLASLFQYTIRQSAVVENQMTSIERIIEYTQIETEDLQKDFNDDVPQDWPKNGQITYENVSYAYDKNLPNVLDKISLKINSQEKIGIVGRTGAGKSSFFQCLLQMGEQTGGCIKIDDIDIKKVSLHRLRSNISIIPQEPALFIGTVRTNIDPFGKKSDHEIWQALESANLKELVETMKSGLDASIERSGSNLSVGQKQLFCLARAILRDTKILIVDEATANVDLKTDALVQEAIRNVFSKRTVITIAHRLQSIMDNDRIICLSHGKLINFDKPFDLLQNQASILYDLVKTMNKNEANNLMKIAKIKQHQIMCDKTYL